MRVAEAMVRRRVEALVRIDEADARDEDEEAGAEIAAEHQLIGGRGLGAAADLSAADLPEGFIECLWIGGRLRQNSSVEDPGRAVRVKFADRDLTQEIPEIRRIRRIGTGPPEIANLAALRVGQGKEPGALVAPAGGPLVAGVLLVTIPANGAQRHLHLDVVLTGCDMVRKERQGLALEALLADAARLREVTSKAVGLGQRRKRITQPLSEGRRAGASRPERRGSGRAESVRTGL